MTKSKKVAKFVTLADSIKNLESDPRIQKAIAEIKRKREVSPARHNRQFNLELMNISMELNGRCQLIGYFTSNLLDESLDTADREMCYQRRREEVLLVTALQVRHDKLVAELDQAIIDEDNSKVS